MKTLHYSIIAILIISCIIVLYSAINFELAEKYFEDQRNGIVCNNPGSSCPYPDFYDPMFYGIIGLGMFFVGTGVSVVKVRTKLIMTILGITTLSAGMPSLLYGILAYVDDYNHLALIMKNCSNPPCMYPNVFTNIQFVQFHGIYGTILVMMGVFTLVYLGRNKK